METTKFNNCLYILGYWKHQKNEVLTIVNNDNFDFEKNYMVEFEFEFSTNLLNSNLENKKSFVKYHIQKIFELANHYKIDNPNDITQLDKNINSDVEYYYKKIYNYFEYLLNHIEHSCFINNIDFQLIFHELNIDNHFNIIGLEITNEQDQPMVPDTFDKYGISTKQRFYLLVKTGLLETEMFKGNKITQGAKHKLIAKILSCDVRTAKGMFNNETTFQMSIENLNTIEIMYNKITKNKDL